MTRKTEIAPTDTGRALADALALVIGDVDIQRSLDMYDTVEGVAARMLTAIPDRLITEPGIGPCYSTAALARWKQLSRQAVFGQYWSGKLFGLKHERKLVFPSIQFDSRGRMRRAFADEFQRPCAERLSADDFATLLHTVEDNTGLSPAMRISASVDGRSALEHDLDHFIPTIVDPPYGAVATEPDEEK
jgi:hypothetical protein